MFPIKKQVIAFCFALMCITDVFAQTTHSLYLFHANPFKQTGGQTFNYRRRLRTCLEGGFLFSFYKNDPHYTNSTQSHGGYLLGVKEEIPFTSRTTLLLGFDFYKQGMSFNSYYFSNGYIAIYNPSDEIFNHNISINEMHFPVEVRFSTRPESKYKRTLYGVIGWVYRMMIYDNALVTNNNTGKFVFEDQDNLTYKYSLFTPIASSIAELGVGYQRNGLLNGNSFYFEIDFKYGISPIIYSGLGPNTAVITFTLTTLAVKLGIRI